ncbi:hypothetical protein QFZ60_002948 [Arthrobacter sp. B2I5]|uniref:hypothetical protein n=1 Tax=Arthrobacter sp. B2I5 TaxID=3042266 RepID=UPI0027881349|nr:hypothetical protein [Arthrobacter sp. B2I5]MDQ0826775.1 hypothetical protein [Arthrobacter sp. B2I5]
MHSQKASDSSASHAGIDRRKLVRRHNVRQQHLDPRSPVSVGNGEFACTMDLTGLQSLPEEYPVGARGDLPPGTLLGTQAQWGWHSVPAPHTYHLDDSTLLYDSPRGPVPYVDMVGDIVNDRETDTSAAETWLRANAHRLDLGRIGLRWVEDGSERAITRAEVTDTEQTLDLWTGVVTSHFTVAGQPVRVTTACHPDRDELGFRVESPALGSGLVVGVGFPYGSEAWHDAADWNSPDAHTTSLTETVTAENRGDARMWTASRQLDNSRYQVKITGQDFTVIQTEQHRLRIVPGTPDRRGGRSVGLLRCFQLRRGR